MANPTKQQEFLETLKDPVRASIRKACSNYHEQNNGQCLSAISVLYLDEHKAHVVAVLANSPDVLETSKDHFISYFKRNIPNAFVHVSARASMKPGTVGKYSIHYFITIGDGSDTIGYTGKTKTDPGYFYCPYVPNFIHND